VDGRVRSVYHSGLGVRLAESLGELAALERAEARERIDADRREDRRAVEACRRVRSAVRGVLKSAGFHEHKRQWRRRRMAKGEEVARQNKAAREEAARLELIAQAVASDDPSEEARALIAEWLAGPGAWRAEGDLMGNALKDAVKAGASLGYLGHEALRRGVEEMRAELLYEQSTLPERLLIEQVLLCWVRLGVLEQSMSWTMKGGTQYTYLNYLQMALTLAQRRYTNAIQTLVRVRRLLRPPAARVQVNAVVMAGAQRPEPITLPAESVRRLKD
jgi:hypothetical protein